MGELIQLAARRAILPMALTSPAAMKAVIDVANSLMRDGYTVAHLNPSCIQPMPAVWLVYNEALQAKVATEAVEYDDARDHSGTLQVGHFERQGVMVMWLVPVKEPH